MSLNHGDTTKQFHVNLKVVYCVHTVGVRVPWVQSLPWRWGLACPGPRVWYWAAPWRPPACQTTALQASRGKEEVSSSSQRTSEGHCKPAAYSQPWRSTIITSHSNTLCIHKIVWNSWKNVTTISWSFLFSNWTEITQIAQTFWLLCNTMWSLSLQKSLKLYYCCSETVTIMWSIAINFRFSVFLSIINYSSYKDAVTCWTFCPWWSWEVQIPHDPEWVHWGECHPLAPDTGDGSRLEWGNGVCTCVWVPVILADRYYSIKFIRWFNRPHNTRLHVDDIHSNYYYYWIHSTSKKFHWWSR